MAWDSSISIEELQKYLKYLKVNYDTEQAVIKSLIKGAVKYGKEAYKKNDLVAEFFNELVDLMGYSFLLYVKGDLSETEAKLLGLKLVIAWEEFNKFFTAVENRKLQSGCRGGECVL